MKYLKTFEGKNLKYDINDYVYVVGYPYISDNFAKIYKINNFVKAYGHWDYLISYIDTDDNTYHDKPQGIYIDEYDIERKLTDDEILDFETKISANKYNL